MQKKIVSLIIVVALMLITIPTVFADDIIKVTIDSKPLYFDVEPTNINGRTLVPLRTIFESLGAEVQWDGSTQTITGTKGNIKVILQINNKIATVNDKKVELDVAAKVIDGRTLVPARFIAESLGAKVNWDGTTSTVAISSSDNIASNLDYYYFLYNGTKVTSNDLASIKSYVNKFGQTYNILMDVSKYNSAIEIYNALKADSTQRNGNLLGIQIFGTSQDVPSFDYIDQVIYYSFNTKQTSTQGSNKELKTDFFYSTFKNDSKSINKDFSIYKTFACKTPASLIPEWKVSRLPLTKGEIAGFIGRYYGYEEQRKTQLNVPIVNFSSPTFHQKLPFYVHQGDDVSFFIERLADDFNVLPKDSYRLYGNQKGIYKVNSKVSGDFTIDNIRSENNKGIADFVFNGHSSPTELLHTYSEVDSKDNKVKEYREPFLTNDTINKVMNKNYYTLFFWSCEPAHNLDNTNLVHEAMANGKCMNAIAGSSEISFNGMWHYYEKYDGLPTLEILKEGNSPYYFIYEFYNNMQQGKSRSESFMLAKKAYAEELLKHTDLSKYENYQTNLMNVLSLHYLGLLEYK